MAAASMLCAEPQYHVAVVYARVFIDWPGWREPQLCIKSLRVDLRAQPDARDARVIGKHGDGRLDQRGPKTGASRIGQNADPSDFARRSVEQKPCSADRTSADPCQKVARLGVTPVQIQRRINALFCDEHDPPKGQTGGKVIGQSDLRVQAKYSARIRA